MSIVGCQVEMIKEAERVLSWLLENSERPAAVSDDVSYALVYDDEGVVWGRLQDNRWILACKWFPSDTPAPTLHSIQQARLFGAHAEIMIWRHRNSIVGRIASDAPVPKELEWLGPEDEGYLLLGEQIVDERSGFTRVASRSGSNQVLPISLRHIKRRVIEPSERVSVAVRHYFAQDSEHGETIVALTRLVDLRKGYV